MLPFDDCPKTLDLYHKSANVGIDIVRNVNFAALRKVNSCGCENAAKSLYMNVKQDVEMQR